MKKVYIKINGKIIFVDVSDEIESALTETRREIWRNDAKEKYYRKVSLSAMTDRDRRINYIYSPEENYITIEEKNARKIKLNTALKTLTSEQLKLVKMLYSGKGVREIARALGKHHSSVEEMIIGIRKKFKKYL